MSGVNFSAPTIKGRQNVDSPELGTIVFDTSTREFWGFDGSSSGGWVNFSARASSTPTGTVSTYAGAAAPAGYVLGSGRTIGGLGSNATERANGDTEALFVLLWSSFSSNELVMQDSNGAIVQRGSSALADFSANRRLALPDLRGRVAVGRDDLGGTAAQRITAGGSGISGSTLGAAGGREMHLLTVGQMPRHSHIQEPHEHSVYEHAGYHGGSREGAQAGDTTTRVHGHITSPTQAINREEGGGEQHNNTQPSIILNYIIKL